MGAIEQQEAEMTSKTFTIDLGASPWGEDCAQLGHTPHFEQVNRIEIALYRAALIALYGPPPPGISLRSATNHHDFGTYRTLEAVIDPLQDDGTQSAYTEKLETGIERWFHAGFSRPEPEGVSNATQGARYCEQAIRGAITTTRALGDGTFFPAEFQTLNANLRAAYPAAAELAIA